MISLVVIEILTYENQTFVMEFFCRSERDDSPVNFVLYGFALLPSPYILDDPAFERSINSTLSM